MKYLNSFGGLAVFVFGLFSAVLALAFSVTELTRPPDDSPDWKSVRSEVIENIQKIECGELYRHLRLHYKPDSNNSEICEADVFAGLDFTVYCDIPADEYPWCRYQTWKAGKYKTFWRSQCELHVHGLDEIPQPVNFVRPPVRWTGDK